MQDGFGTRGRESCAGWVLAVGLGGSCLTGCVELEELGNTLLDPEGEALSVPGSQIAQGLFSNIDLVHSVEHGPVLVALNDDGAEPRLSATKLGAIEKTATCFGAPTQWFQAARRVMDHNGVRWLGSSTSGLILSGGNSTGGMPDALRFTGYDCAEVVAPRAGANVLNANFLGNGTAIGALVEAEGSLPGTRNPSGAP